MRACGQPVAIRNTLRDNTRPRLAWHHSSGRRIGPRQRARRGLVRPSGGALGAGFNRQGPVEVVEAGDFFGVREKLNRSKFDLMRSGWADFGMTVMPCSRCQRRTTWAGVT